MLPLALRHLINIHTPILCSALKLLKLLNQLQLLNIS